MITCLPMVTWSCRRDRSHTTWWWCRIFIPRAYAAIGDIVTAAWRTWWHGYIHTCIINLVLLDGWMDWWTIGYWSGDAIKFRETNLSWSSSCCTFLPLPLPRPVMLLSSNLIQGSTHRLLCNNSKSKLGSMREVLVHPYNIIVNKLSGYRGVIF